MKPTQRRPSSGYHRELSTRIPDAGADHHDDEVPIKACLAPKELYEHIVQAGVVKSKWRWDKQIAMGLIAAFYIGFSYTGMMVVGGQIPTIQHEHPGIYNLVLGCFGFPLGLFMICVVGADLFTSDCSYMAAAFLEGEVSLYDVARSWIVSWWVNLAGSIMMALLVYWAWIFDGRSDFTLYFAHKKVSNPFGVCLCKGILANWLVNLAVWIANSSQDITGKAVGIFLPISCFIAMGGEHCIANMYLFALAKLLGSDITIGTMITKNLIPSTLGNLIGGAFFVSTMYSFAIGNLFDRTYATAGVAYRTCTGRAPTRKSEGGAAGPKKQAASKSGAVDGAESDTTPTTTTATGEKSGPISGALRRAFLTTPAAAPSYPIVTSAVDAMEDDSAAPPRLSNNPKQEMADMSLINMYPLPDKLAAAAGNTRAGIPRLSPARHVAVVMAAANEGSATAAPGGQIPAGLDHKQGPGSDGSSKLPAGGPVARLLEQSRRIMSCGSADELHQAEQRQAAAALQARGSLG